MHRPSLVSPRFNIIFRTHRCDCFGGHKNGARALCQYEARRLQNHDIIPETTGKPAQRAYPAHAPAPQRIEIGHGKLRISGRPAAKTDAVLALRQYSAGIGPWVVLYLQVICRGQIIGPQKPLNSLSRRIDARTFFCSCLSGVRAAASLTITAMRAGQHRCLFRRLTPHSARSSLMAGKITYPARLHAGGNSSE